MKPLKQEAKTMMDLIEEWHHHRIEDDERFIPLSIAEQREKEIKEAIIGSIEDLRDDNCIFDAKEKSIIKYVLNSLLKELGLEE
jgi:hypothetical protein